MKQDLLQAGVGGADAFDGISAKANDVATPLFTSNHLAQNNFFQAGIHERDMYMSISSSVINAISTVFVESWDDILVVKALDGMRNSAYICSYFGLNEQFNHVLDLLLGFGLDYLGSVTSLMHLESIATESNVIASDSLGGNEEQTIYDLEAEFLSRNIPRLPKSFLTTLKDDDVGNQSVHFDTSDMAGSVAHQGLLLLQCALTLSKNHLSIIN